MKQKNINITDSIQTGISNDRFKELFRDFYPKLLAYTMSILNNKYAAEDIVQEVFLYVWENRDKIQFGDGIFSYLFQSAYSRSLDNIKKSNRFDEYVRQALVEMTNEHYYFLKNDSAILKQLFSKDFLEELSLLLSRLPERRRKAFELIYFEGLKAREVSELMQLPQRTVESHIYLTMKYLRENMKISDFLFFISVFKLF